MAGAGIVRVIPEGSDEQIIRRNFKEINLGFTFLEQLSYWTFVLNADGEKVRNADGDLVRVTN